MIFTFTDGPDLVFGGDTPGNNTWRLLKGEDVLFSGIGDDLVFAGNGADFVDANRGNDEVHGGDGHDQLNGGRGRDLLFGENGNDELRDNGDDRADRMVGGAGNDLIVTDGGRMRLGSGSDTLFVDLEAPSAQNNQYLSVTHVLDFQSLDHLTMSSTTPAGFLDTAAILNRLDRNDDHWLGAKDVAPSAGGFSVHIVNGNLDLEIDHHHLVLHELTKASFDFLS